MRVSRRSSTSASWVLIGAKRRRPSALTRGRRIPVSTEAWWVPLPGPRPIRVQRPRWSVSALMQLDGVRAPVDGIAAQGDDRAVAGGRVEEVPVGAGGEAGRQFERAQRPAARSGSAATSPLPPRQPAKVGRAGGADAEGVDRPGAAGAGVEELAVGGEERLAQPFEAPAADREVPALGRPHGRAEAAVEAERAGRRVAGERGQGLVEPRGHVEVATVGADHEAGRLVDARSRSRRGRRPGSACRRGRRSGRVRCRRSGSRRR